MKLKLAIVGAIGALFLAGCATTAQQAQTQYVQACLGASATLGALTAVKPNLNATQAQAVQTAAAQIDPICSGPLPSDPNAATTRVTAAVTTLAVTLAAQAATKGK